MTWWSWKTRMTQWLALNINDIGETLSELSDLLVALLERREGGITKHCWHRVPSFEFAIATVAQTRRGNCAVIISNTRST